MDAATVLRGRSTLAAGGVLTVASLFTMFLAVNGWGGVFFIAAVVTLPMGVSAGVLVGFAASRSLDIADERVPRVVFAAGFGVAWFLGLVGTATLMNSNLEVVPLLANLAPFGAGIIALTIIGAEAVLSTGRVRLSS